MDGSRVRITVAALVVLLAVALTKLKSPQQTRPAIRWELIVIVVVGYFAMTFLRALLLGHW
jgi:hypothetical protein